MKLMKEKTKEAFKELKEKLGLKNVMQSPKIVKVVVNSGVGSFSDKKKIDVVIDRLSKITGQKPIKRGAKQSVASFKSREGDIVGVQITLRGEKMWSFLDRLFNIALPRTKDFRGISAEAIDEMGNYTLSIKEHIVFPETADEDLKDVFGFSATIVTSLKNKSDTLEFFKHLGFPFKKIVVKK
ncbi:MAG: 50S ribosomal protein L5 [Candidatus Zambryskibacteria bacterium RIFCSPLOWO2_01_FULL_39_39]|uniref:Large ribosomal subunit protein uL5 n=1 Tax=Candidatus Zambryskibacteria bacterium RIFCSPLOWO2_01_FULL_39_39 TaxID=1802758 RepID=A0A1G2TZU8_9BACT|nr:MAG: 50S ribosomal protein L5 [Parcubacteria group bacterium GW2011_GWA1_38_7]OHA86796.1 MAG: 50S ribosomal protein L5 [Candidatus Zambryskibacteria bacterium RIFCSPHIGHO2_01_FULL_39_63]OHA94677.1 MAG: 50S ribosomal protein L5 [Candidatus Zambryskibacteria bacterium RIFCSPHIGHO2_02_FULL_39_19]OHB02140.1 MAG: 50S ribosomal protein L5 [Candidatus Zambryskibacteria bacterium RIFCSPLOWO2_01_FULL_39_39]